MANMLFFSNNQKTMDSINKALADFARQALDQGITTEDDAKQMMYKLNDNFRKDKIFNEIFPTVFGLEFCKRKLAEQKPKTQKIIIMDDCLADKASYTKTDTILNSLTAFSFYDQKNEQHQKEPVLQLYKMEEVD